MNGRPCVFGRTTFAKHAKTSDEFAIRRFGFAKFGHRDDADGRQRTTGIFGDHIMKEFVNEFLMTINWGANAKGHTEA